MGLKAYPYEVIDLEEAARCGRLNAAWWNDPPAGRWVIPSRVPVTTTPAVQPTDDELDGQLAVIARPLDRAILWVTATTKKVPAALPPQLRVQLRGCFECVPTVLETKNIQMPAWNDTKGMLFQFSGLLIEQWEIWAAAWDGLGNAQAVRLTWAIEVDHVGCCDRTTVDGPWVVP